MNWKSTIAAAIAVIAAGLGTGLAIGGKTKTVTTTLAKTVTSTVTDTTSDTTSAPVSTPTPGTPTSDTKQGDPVTPDEPIQAESDAFVPVAALASDAFAYNEVAQLRLGSAAPGFDIGLDPVYNNATGDTQPKIYEFEITNPDTESPRSFVTTMGFTKTGTTSGLTMKVSFRYDDFNSAPVLQFTLPSSGSQSVRKVSIPVKGKTNLSVVIKSDDKTWPENGVTLTMLQPGFVATG